MTISISTELYNYHHNQFLKTLITPTRNAAPISVSTDIPQPLAPGSNYILLYIPDISYNTELFDMWSLASDSFHLA